MGKIVILDENTANKIAAGEVIERPASVIKELVENSIDAGATSISVEIKNGGIAYIKVTDNGSGIEEDDTEIAFERHGTSKIRNANDLETISTMGFRGEALASIAAVSHVELTTRVKENSHGTYIKIQGGVVREARQTGCPAGTTFVIRDLFFNTPARYKFLKKDATEAGYVSEALGRIALGNPQISFKLVNSGAVLLHTPGNNDLLSTIYSIYGKETAKDVLPVDYTDNKVKITGFAGKAEIARANRSQQSIYINKRFIKNKVITSAIDEAYKTYLMKSKFPFIVLNIEINPALVDVNVHPAKLEVRFSDEQEIFRSVFHAVINALQNKTTKVISPENHNRDIFKFKDPENVKVKYEQQGLELHRAVVKEEPAVFQPAAKQETVVEKPVLKTNEPVKEILDNTPREVKDVPQKTELAPQKVVIESPQIIQNILKEEPINTAPTEPAAEPKPKEINHLFSLDKIVGQAFSTYIILQRGEELLFIDQHAAHERIMYETIKRKFQNHENFSQFMLAPVVIELTNREIKFLEDKIEFFSRFGFTFENFGNNSIILRAVTNVMEETSVKEVFLDILDYLLSNANTDFSLVSDEAIYTLACKSAIKANKKMDELEIKNIIHELEKMENPYTCPHGRPTIVKMSKYELEKKFKRVL